MILSSHRLEVLSELCCQHHTVMHHCTVSEDKDATVMYSQ